MSGSSCGPASWAASPWLGVRTSLSASVSAPTPVAGAGLKTVIAPAALAHSEGLGRRVRRDLVPYEHDVAGPRTESLERLADVPGFEGGVGAARDRDAVLAPGIDEDQRDAGRLIGERP